MDNIQDRPADEEVRTGLAQLQRYLGDEVAPMMVADSIQPLLSEAPEVVIPVIRDWITVQRRAEGPELTIGACLFHAVERIYFLSQLQLIDKLLMADYARGLGKLVVNLCPPDQRELLLKNLASLGKRPLAAPGSQLRLKRDAGDAGSSAPASDRKRQRHFSLMVDRLKDSSNDAILTQDEHASAGPSLRDQVVAASAVGARSEDEFQRYRQQLVETGVDARTEQVFRSLAETLPGWTLPEDPDHPSDDPDWAKSRALDAMRRIITGSDVRQGSKRFVELVEAAVQRFNAGSLPQAHKMFRLAQGLVDEGKVRPEVLKSLKTRLAGALAHDQLLRSAEDTGRRHLLRHILEFFPDLQVQGLLRELVQELVKERRRLQLVLLEVHGASARPGILKLLQNFLTDRSIDRHGFQKRNLVFLMRRIHRDEGSSPETDIQLLAPMLTPAMPFMVVNEAVGVVSQIRHPSAESALRQLLRDLEKQLMDADPSCNEDTLVLMDRTVAGLARMGSSTAVEAVLQHGIRREPRLGSPFGRLAELAATDISAYPESLDQLLESLKRALPGRLLGLVGFKRRDQVEILIRALSGTADDKVIGLLMEIANRYPGESFGELANDTVKAMQVRSDPGRSSSPGLAGDLELFGLSDLLQTLAGSQRTGCLTLMDQDTLEIGVLMLVEGKIKSARAGGLEHRAAVYQLFERPTPGSFTFRAGTRHSAGEEATDEELLEVMPLMMEAIRRHDVLQQADVLVPADLRLIRGEGKPTRPEHENSPELLRALWKKVISGAAPAGCEESLAVDSYRVRCAIAHWLEEGSLQPQPA